jgi:hypothetical protein
LLPFFSPVSGVPAHRFPRQRRFGHTAVGAEPVPLDTHSFIIGGKAGNPEGLKKALFAPEPERPMNGA